MHVSAVLSMTGIACQHGQLPNPNVPEMFLATCAWYTLQRRSQFVAAPSVGHSAAGSVVPLGQLYPPQVGTDSDQGQCIWCSGPS